MAKAEQVDAIKLSPFQERVLATPEDVDLFLGGGRGGGKSFTLALLALRHAEQYGARARALYIRQSFPGVRDFETLTLELYSSIYGASARYNSADKVWRFPNGATLELQQAQTQQQLTKFQGRSATLLLADECGEWSSPEILDRLRGNLRSPRGVPTRVVMAANPGGVGHSWLRQRHVDGRTPWLPYETAELGAKFVSCPSTHEDNPFLDHESYKAQLLAATATDPELREAWIGGDWFIVRGGIYFEGVNWERITLDGDSWSPGWLKSENGKPFRPDWRVHEQGPPRWRSLWSIDHGRSAPLVALLAVRPRYAGLPTPDGREVSKEAWAIIDEVALHDPNDLNRGLGLDIADAALHIHGKADEWGLPTRAVLDAACFARHGHDRGSLAAEYERSGIRVSESSKGSRIGGWERLRRLLLADDGEAQVLISDRCRYLLETLRTLPRDGDDLDTRAADHAADALRYLVMTDYAGGEVTVTRADFLR